MANDPIPATKSTSTSTTTTLPTIPQTILAHSIPAINHLYSPVHFNSKPIVGILLVIRGVSGSGKTTTTNAILNNRIPLSNRQASVPNLTDSALLHPEHDIAGLDRDLNIVLSSDEQYEFPATYSLHRAHKLPNSASPQPETPYQARMYSWDPYFLELTHYFCRAHAHNTLLRHWTRCLRTPSPSSNLNMATPPTSPSLPRSVDELPIVILDNTSLSPKQILPYFLSCILHGFIMINVEPTTPWSAHRYGQIRAKVQQIESAMKQLHFDHLQTHMSQDDNNHILCANDLDLISLISQYCVEPTTAHSAPTVDQSSPTAIKINQLASQRRELCDQLDEITQTLFQRNTHQVPFPALVGMLRTYEPLGDVYDLFKVK